MFRREVAMEGPSALESAERRLVDTALASWDTLCSTPCLRWLLSRRRQASALCEDEEARAALVVPIWSPRACCRSRCPHVLLLALPLSYSTG